MRPSSARCSFEPDSVRWRIGCIPANGGDLYRTYDLEIGVRAAERALDELVHRLGRNLDKDHPALLWACHPQRTATRRYSESMAGYPTSQQPGVLSCSYHTLSSALRSSKQ